MTWLMTADSGDPAAFVEELMRRPKWMARAQCRKAYLSQANLQAVEDAGGTAFIPYGDTMGSGFCDPRPSHHVSRSPQRVDPYVPLIRLPRGRFLRHGAVHEYKCAGGTRGEGVGWGGPVLFRVPRLRRGAPDAVQVRGLKRSTSKHCWAANSCLRVHFTPKVIKPCGTVGEKNLLVCIAGRR